MLQCKPFCYFGTIYAEGLKKQLHKIKEPPVL